MDSIDGYLARVSHSRIFTSSFWYNYQNDDVKILECDTRAKYPSVEVTSYGEGYVSFSIGRSQYTLHDENTTDLTEIIFSDLGPGKWAATAEAWNRYGIIFVLYRENSDGSVAWQDNDPHPEGI